MRRETLQAEVEATDCGGRRQVARNAGTIRVAYEAAKSIGAERLTAPRRTTLPNLAAHVLHLDPQSLVR